MGGSESAGHLHLEVRDRNIPAGGIVTGIVHFKLDAPMKAASLNLEFSGEEFCSWEEFRTVRKTGLLNTRGTERRVFHQRGRRDIIKQVFPVFVFQDSRVSPGQYSFPFSFTAPATLPVSFEVAIGRSEAYIRYVLVASIHPRVKVESSQVDILVTEQLTNTPVTGEMISRLVTFGCFTRGSLLLRATADRSGYALGEMADIRVEADNSQGRLNVTSFSAVLERKIRLFSEGGEKRIVTRVSERLENRMCRAGEMISGADAVRLSLSLRDPSGLRYIASVRSQCVECTYSIIVAANTDGVLACGQKPTVRQVIVICPVRLPQLPLPPVPVDWRPQVMQVAHWAIPEDYQPSAPPFEDNQHDLTRHTDYPHSVVPAKFADRL